MITNIKNIFILSMIALILNGCFDSKNDSHSDSYFNKNGYDVAGFNSKGFNKYGYDVTGYDKNGYDKNGYDVVGFNSKGFNKNGYDENGFNSKGFDKYGLDVNGYDKNGYDVNGFNSKGFNKDGYTFNGLSKKEVLKKEILQKRLNKIINSNSTIKKVFTSNLRKLTKDKYESDIEYETRMKNTQFINHAILEIDVTTKYDANKKLYKIFLDTNPPLLTYQNKFIHGKFSYKYGLKNNLGKLALSDCVKDKEGSSIQSNAFGATVEVTEEEKVKYVIYPDNIKNILQNSKIGYGKGYFNIFNSYYIGIKTNKKTAKKWDIDKLKLKINVSINNHYDLCEGRYIKAPTIDSPYDYSDTYYLFKGHISKLILYDQKTKEIIFSYID